MGYMDGRMPAGEKWCVISLKVVCTTGFWPSESVSSHEDSFH